MKTKYLYLLPIFLLFYCTNRSYKETSIVENFELGKPQKYNASEFFDESYSITTLEDNGSEKLGRINKIVKSENGFFILSDDKRILQFAHDGTYISVLQAVGKAPEEYSSIADFNVYLDDSQENIWIADYKSIKIYGYEKDWKLKHTIQFPFVVNKFIKLNNDKLLLMTGQEDKSLALVNGKGEVLSQFLNKEIPFLTFKPVQFIAKEDEILFPLGSANNCIVFNTQKQIFTEAKWLNTRQFMDKEKLVKMFEEHGYDYLTHLKNENIIRTIRCINGVIILDYTIKNRRHLSIYRDNQWKHTQIDELRDDILNTSSNNSLYLTLLMGESQNSILLIKEPENLQDTYAILEIQ